MKRAGIIQCQVQIQISLIVFRMSLVTVLSNQDLIRGRAFHLFIVSVKSACIWSLLPASPPPFFYATNLLERP